MLLLLFLVILTIVNAVGSSSMAARPGVEVFKHGEKGFPCIRAPSIVSTNSGVLVAFAMCRLYTGDGCKPTNDYQLPDIISDPPNAYVCSRRSIDGGQTWSNLSFPFGKKYYSRIGGSVYDSFNNQILFQSNVYDQSSNETIYQIISTDDGETWSNPLDIGRLYLGNVGTNHLIGPGNGLQLSKSGRILFVAHYENQDPKHNDTADRVWYSDDFGKTYKLSPSFLQNMDEATMTELGNGSVMVNMRNKIYTRDMLVDEYKMKDDRVRRTSIFDSQLNQRQKIMECLGNERKRLSLIKVTKWCK